MTKGYLVMGVDGECEDLWCDLGALVSFDYRYHDIGAATSVSGPLRMLAHHVLVVV